MVKETGVSYYEAFQGLYQTDMDLNEAKDYLKDGKAGLEKVEYLGQLIFDPETWQKLEYIIGNVSCNLGEAFEKLLECEEDEFAAMKAIKEKKNGKK